MFLRVVEHPAREAELEQRVLLVVRLRELAQMEVVHDSLRLHLHAHLHVRDLLQLRLQVRDVLLLGLQVRVVLERGQARAQGDLVVLAAVRLVRLQLGLAPAPIAVECSARYGL